jgi:anti-sigma regulatory factor (Ser/Thr protein kinase)
MSGGMSIHASPHRAGVVHAAGSGTGMGGAVAARSRPRMPVPPPYKRHTAMTREWPLASFLELGAFPGAVPCARAHAKAVLWEWGSDLLDQAELVVSELMTNSVQASALLVQPAVVRLWVVSDRRQVVIMVWDASPRSPAGPANDLNVMTEGGRGLMLVEAISDQWSWYSVPGGKVVWALWNMRASGGADDQGANAGCV